MATSSEPESSTFQYDPGECPVQYGVRIVNCALVSARSCWSLHCIAPIIAHPIATGKSCGIGYGFSPVFFPEYHSNDNLLTPRKNLHYHICIRKNFRNGYFWRNSNVALCELEIPTAAV